MPAWKPDGGPLEAAIREVTASDPVFLLAEIKIRSPRDGQLVGDRDPAALAREMADAGAGGVSVVVESEHFGGSLELLETVDAAVDVPVLAKDFFTTEAAIDRAVSHGADAVLLISGDLSVGRRAALIEHCRDAGVSALLETHTPAEVEAANDLGAPIVGINNRDIDRLELDGGGVERTERLAPRVHDDAVILSESSLSSAEEVSRAVAAGADAVLVGTAILNAPDPRAKIGELTL
jgi:indole-3-glycerol phosphate synthase